MNYDLKEIIFYKFMKKLIPLHFADLSNQSFVVSTVMLALTRLSAKLLIVLIQNTDSLSCNYVV